jgi:DNA-binding transcriptional ArsR family regulator
MDEMSPTLERAMHAFNDKGRRSIIYAIDAAKTTVEEISSETGIKENIVEKQLKVLENSGMITIDEKDKKINLTKFCEHFIQMLFLSLDPSKVSEATKEPIEGKKVDPIGEAIKAYRDGRSTWKV